MIINHIQLLASTNNFIINLFIQLTVINENRIHLLQFLNNEATLTNHRLNGDAATHELLIHCHELCQLFVVYQILELFYLVLKADHSIKLLINIIIHHQSDKNTINMHFYP